MEVKKVRPRGAVPTPRAKLAAAVPFRPTGVTPPQFAMIPSKLSYWLNNQYGDCVTAEEAFAKACYSPEIYIQDATVYAWAAKHGVLDGADLLEVLQAMQQHGFDQDGNIYNDGAPLAVDYTNPGTLTNAISQGPVKIGVAAQQLESVVGGSNGWCLTGAYHDRNEDHSVSLCGYGPMSWLAQQLGVNLPHGVDGSKPGYLLFTWDTIGIIDHASMVNITGEAWLRNPTTVIVGPNPPVPPVPPVPPTPIPPPCPSYQDAVLTVYKPLKVGTYSVCLVPGVAGQAGEGLPAIPWAMLLQILIAILQQLVPPTQGTVTELRRSA